MRWTLTIDQAALFFCWGWWILDKLSSILMQCKWSVSVRWASTSTASEFGYQITETVRTPTTKTQIDNHNDFFSLGEEKKRKEEKKGKKRKFTSYR